MEHLMATALAALTNPMIRRSKLEEQVYEQLLRTLNVQLAFNEEAYAKALKDQFQVDYHA